MQTINANTTPSSAIHPQNIFRLRLRHEQLFCHQMIFFGLFFFVPQLLQYGIYFSRLLVLLFIYYYFCIMVLSFCSTDCPYIAYYFFLFSSFIFSLPVTYFHWCECQITFCILYIVCSCSFFIRLLFHLDSLF